MNQHPYLRAYMAGITVPTFFLLFVATGFCILRFVCNIPVPIERVIVFPMAAVPNLWGLWNVLFIASHERTHLPIGFHGALLPIVLAPLGFILTRILDFPVPEIVAKVFPIGGLIALIAYYLVWKYLVHFLNRILSLT